MQHPSSSTPFPSTCASLNRLRHVPDVRRRRPKVVTFWSLAVRLLARPPDVVSSGGPKHRERYYELNFKVASFGFEHCLTKRVGDHAIRRALASDITLVATTVPQPTPRLISHVTAIARQLLHSGMYAMSQENNRFFPTVCSYEVFHGHECASFYPQSHILSGIR